MITCSKSYRDIPLSHRQPNHNGRCSRLHGHSWSITLTFVAKELDENGFVVDFGDLHFIEDWIDQHLDHATAVWENDPKLDQLKALEADGLIKLVLVPSASCEGIAQFLFHNFNPMVEEKTARRARIRSIHLEEDTKNSATYQPDQTA